MPECLVLGLREQTDNYSVDSAVRGRSAQGWSPAFCLEEVSGWGCHSLGWVMGVRGRAGRLAERGDHSLTSDKMGVRCRVSRQSPSSGAG